MFAFQAENVGSIPTTRMNFYLSALTRCFPGEMVDTLDLKSDAARRNGSSPLGSIFIFIYKKKIRNNDKKRSSKKMESLEEV